MVFLAGPRQVGKTTAAKMLLKTRKGIYLNWDSDIDRTKILDHDFKLAQLIVFDEIHKYARWRNWLKGLYDTKPPSSQILVTGSARLDLYRRGGDSLQGRYHLLRLHPLSVAELKISTQNEFESLVKLGGFPEPFFSQSEQEARRWSREYRARIIRDEISSLERVADLATMERLLGRLPQLVGSPLSITSLREDLGPAFETVAKWLEIFERLFVIFRLSPYGPPRLRAVKKEQKHYHYDWSIVPSVGARFENLVACHLLKWVNFREDTEGFDMDLRYFRDRDGREVDFVVMKQESPELFVECKSKLEATSTSLIYLKKKFPNVRAVQVHMEKQARQNGPIGIEHLPAIEFLSQLI